MSAFGATLSTASATFTMDDRAFQKGGKRVIASMERMGQRLEKVATAARRLLIVGVGVITGFVALAGKQEKAEAKLAAVIKATGGAAGFTAKQLIKEAAALQKVTTFGDEAIINAQAIIATFKQIKGDAFKATTEAVLDMAIALDQDLKSAAIQVGKAMNDPILGATALSRAGVQFTEQQRKMIRTFVESNRLFEAQAIILNELEGQFGGVARAFAQTDTGKLVQLKNVLGDIGETLGSIFTPALADAADRLKENAVAITESIDRSRDAIKVNTILAAKFLVFLVVLPKIVKALRLVVTALVSVKLAAIGLGAALFALVPLALVAALSAVNQQLESMKRNLREAKAAGQGLRDALKEIAAAEAIGDLRGVLAGKQKALTERRNEAVRIRTRIQELQNAQEASAKRREEQPRGTGGRVLAPGRNERMRELEIRDLLHELQVLRLVITESHKQIRRLEAEIETLGLGTPPAADAPSDPAAPAAGEGGLTPGRFFSPNALFQQIQRQLSARDKEAQTLSAAQATSKNTKKSADNTSDTAKNTDNAVSLLQSIDDRLAAGFPVFT